MAKVLITGGSGSFGRALIPMFPDVCSLTNNEYEHWEVQKDFGIKSYLCDIKDVVAVSSVILDADPDVVIHAAALKHVPYGEEFEKEFWATNYWGSFNVAGIAKLVGVKKAILISTDKAKNPTTAYGRTKLGAEGIFHQFGYSAIRFVNFWGSRGSVIPLWKEQAEKKGYIEVTDPDMERYFISLDEAANSIVQCIEGYEENTIWTPQNVKLWSLRELAQEVCPDVPIKIIGNRGNEKMMEEL